MIKDILTGVGLILVFILGAYFLHTLEPTEAEEVQTLNDQLRQQQQLCLNAGGSVEVSGDTSWCFYDDGIKLRI